jgi:curli biogenesis system outer membrane secretion channel CsgG
MRPLFVVAIAAALAGCGVETATTAATAASIKKQELTEGKKTMERAQQKIDGAMQQMQQRTASSEEQK